MGHLAAAPALDQRPSHPVTEDNRDACWQVLRDVARMEEPAHSAALPWIRAEAAKGLVQKVVTALGEGAGGMMIGNLEDWLPDEGPAI